MVKSGKLLILGARCPDDFSHQTKEFKIKVLAGLNDDLPGKVAKGDAAILAMGSALFEKLGRERASDIRHRMRLLARLKIDLNKANLPEVSLGGRHIDLDHYIRPDCFNQMYQSIQAVSGVTDERTVNGVKMLDKPGLALKLVGLVKKVATMKIGRSIKIGDKEARTHAEDYIFLHEKEMVDKITSAARQTLKERKFNQKELLPLTKDLVRLAKYQDEEIGRLSATLGMYPTVEDWKELAYVILSKVISFNKRRGDEAAKLMVESYKNRSDWRQCNTEIADSLPAVEKHLLKT